MEHSTRLDNPDLQDFAVPTRRIDGVVGVGQRPREAINNTGPLEILCGPLINYNRTSEPDSQRPIWHGTILIVTPPALSAPILELRCLGAVHPEVEPLDGGTSKASTDGPQESDVCRDLAPERLYQDPKSTFWRYNVELPIQEAESRWEYHIPQAYLQSQDRSSNEIIRTFAVPSIHESMRILFHSCNGFSAGTDEEEWHGCALWKDVLRIHIEKPFHVMIGGGDQIYNDGVRHGGPLTDWTNIKNPKRRRNYKFGTELRAECDDYYFQNYKQWYSAEPFARANAQIPQINIWDDHDIIDGFGSYTDNFMRSSVFRGLGGVAYKYYSLFQHHYPPPVSTYSTDAPQTMHTQTTSGPDPAQLSDTFVMTENKEEPSYLIGSKPGPYVEESSRSIFCRLGAHIAFLGIDARTERTRHQINYPETYDLLFNHASQQIILSAGRIRHLILLLGVPIAYPRLEWLENVFRSPIIAPIRLLNKRFGFGGSFFNSFDGSVELLDDLDDHYATSAHKEERKQLVHRLQSLARAHSVRVTILGGDVHLAAFGRFYSNPRLGLELEHDWRYMPNVISSAITNHPPPQQLADFLARRNRIHHLDEETDETLLHIFDADPHHPERPDETHRKTKSWNYVTMPSRNYAIISEAHPHTHSHAQQRPGAQTTNSSSTTPSSPASPPVHANGKPRDVFFPTAHHNWSKHTGQRSDPREPLSKTEQGCGANHPAATGRSGSKGGGGNTQAGRYDLDICYRVEVNHADPEGRTMGYGVSVPSLSVGKNGSEGNEGRR